MLSRIFFYLILRPLSHLPLSVLYLLSDFIFVVVYYVVGYRRDIVFSNIKSSFKDKSQKELKAIEKEYYRHFSDLLVESVRTFSMSEQEVLKRMNVLNPELLDEFQEKGQDVVAVGGHNGNWELYAVACAKQLKHRPMAFYTPLTNKYFDRVFKKNRSRFGLQMIPTKEIKNLPEDFENPTMVIFGIDQCPKRSQKPYWLEFLGQETAVQFGAEKFARERNLPVVFGNIYKKRRGYYDLEYKLVCEDPSSLQTGEVMKRSTEFLEEAIKSQPAYWLWSHKRWKYKKEDYLVNK